MKSKTLLAGLLFAAGLATATAAMADESNSSPLVIREQGSFAAGGTVIPARETYNPLKPQAAGQTLHGDHAYVFYQVPADARKYPLVFLHGAGQSAKTWETTPDGREGFQNIFLRRGFGVYLKISPDAAMPGEAPFPPLLRPSLTSNSGSGSSGSASGPTFLKERSLPVATNR
ncbi:hypothetical protein HMPREF0178_00854 [Bilophila sp. 4_1_30]|uniref:hypothetical protein n=1 Tax=Bilophila sp. 4_1_30 TaxID=693988 RepID=UPI0002238802|nr:hypothetical protein [Bilophila sp. 4_1_30]EGW42394.1 hypothetical protein HMPREF0178_00854 [Bilophila sp. 4_1_30]